MTREQALGVIRETAILGVDDSIGWQGWGVELPFKTLGYRIEYLWNGKNRGYFWKLDGKPGVWVTDTSLQAICWRVLEREAKE